MSVQNGDCVGRYLKLARLKETYESYISYLLAFGKWEETMGLLYDPPQSRPEYQKTHMALREKRKRIKQLRQACAVDTFEFLRGIKHIKRHHRKTIYNWLYRPFEPVHCTFACLKGHEGQRLGHSCTLHNDTGPVTVLKTPPENLISDQTRAR